MAQIFPEWANRLPLITVMAAVIVVAGVCGFFWYYGSPKFTDVGYRPRQPVSYSHKLHAGDLGLDCRYCHSAVERSPVANVPPTQTCMNCHRLILPASEKLLRVRESWAEQRPIQWIQIHKLPDYAYFDHSAHLAAGVGCASCHDNVADMEVVMQVEPLSMGWCLDCHRDPGPSLRPRQDLTRMNWTPPADQADIAAQVIREKQLAPPVICSGCHR